MILALRNGFWLILPVIVWNVVFASRLTASGFTDDSAVPLAILWSEMALRVLLFTAPVLLAVKLPLSTRWLTALVAGYALYFASWLPHLLAPDGPLAQHPAIILGPAITPLIWLLAIAALTGSRLYAAASFAFIAVHVPHQLFSFQLL